MEGKPEGVGRPSELGLSIAESAANLFPQDVTGGSADSTSAVYAMSPDRETYEKKREP